MVIGIAVRLWGVYAREVPNPQADEANNLMAQTISECEEGLRIGRQITNAATARQFASQWIAKLATVATLAEQLEKYSGARVNRSQGSRNEQLVARSKTLSQQMNAEVGRLLAIPEVAEIMAAAIQEQTARNPQGAFARMIEKSQ